MKRTTALLIFAIMLLAAAVPASAQFRYAAVAGATLNDLKFKQDLFDVKKTAGFQVGVQGELMFPGIGFGIDFALLYNQASAKTDLGSREVWSSDGFGNPVTMVHMLQIPLHLRFKWTRMNGLEDYIAPFVYGGPDFGLAVGHNSIKGNEGEPNPYKYSGGDLGLTCGGGLELWKNWQVSVQYTWGMTYLLKTRKLDNFSAKNRQWAFRVAYFF